MNKKEILILFIFIGLSAAFLLISAMVYFSHGKSKKWVARKMSIGAILLSLANFSCHNSEPEVSCYIINYGNTVSLESKYKNFIDVEKNNILKGTSSYGGENYSFSITNSNSKKIQTGNLVPIDGKFDSLNEKFSITLNKSIKPGIYHLRFFDVPVNMQDITTATGWIKLIIAKKSSFEIIDNSGTIYQKGDFVFNGKIDTSERFRIELDKKLKSGKYLLQIYYKKSFCARKEAPVKVFNLIIKK